jgi:hypothetical protein
LVLTDSIVDPRVGLDAAGVWLCVWPETVLLQYSEEQSRYKIERRFIIVVQFEKVKKRIVGIVTIVKVAWTRK